MAKTRVVEQTRPAKRAKAGPYAEKHAGESLVYVFYNMSEQALSMGSKGRLAFALYVSGGSLKDNFDELDLNSDPAKWARDTSRSTERPGPLIANYKQHLASARLSESVLTAIELANVHDVDSAKVEFRSETGCPRAPGVRVEKRLLQGWSLRSSIEGVRR